MTQVQRHSLADEEGVETITTMLAHDYTAKDTLILENPAPAPRFDLMTQASDVLEHWFLDGQFTSSSTLSIDLLDTRLITSDIRMP